MKPFRLPLVLSASLVLPVSAATITFDNPPYPDPPSPTNDGAIAGIDGWTQSEANPAPDTPLFYTSADSNDNRYGTISGFYDIPLGSSFSASRDLDLGGAPNIGETTFSTRVSLQPPTIDFPENDTFGFSLSGTFPLLDVSFVPTALTGPAVWEVVYTVAGSTPVESGLALQLNGNYNMVVAFNASGFDFTFQAGNGTTSTTVSGTPAGYNPSSTSDLDLDLNWSITDGNSDFGDGVFVVSNIKTVPEPGIFAIAALSGLAALRRRRVT